MSDVLNLDFLLEKATPAGKVVLDGVEYDLFRADILENFMALTAMTERVSAALNAREGDPAAIAEEMERLRQELRNLIRVIVPGMSDEVLRQKLPKLGQLQGLFQSLVMKAHESLPESVKKNSETTLSEPETTPESGKISP